MQLSEKSRAILKAIAEGHTYEQILIQDLAWTYYDIFRAAAEALGTPQKPTDGKAYSMEEIRQEHPRAYEKWGADEDRQLSDLHLSGKGVSEIARILCRQESAIRSRLAKQTFVAPA